MRQYKAYIYPGRITLFLSSKHPANLITDRLLAWPLLRHVEIYAGPTTCDGDTMLLEPHVRVFAQLLQKNLHHSLG